MSRQALQCPSCSRRFSTEGAIAEHRSATHDNSAWIAQRARKAAAAAEFQAGGKRRLPQGEGATQAPVCPSCGLAAKLSVGRWGIKAECCGIWSWKLKPLVDRETHASRIQAHDAFDRLWKSGMAERHRCYAALASMMALTRDQCHIAQMTAAQCRQVMTLVNSGALLAAMHQHAIARESTGA